MQPKIYISYSPGKPGSVFALFYFECGDDVYGWHIEAKNDAHIEMELTAYQALRLPVQEVNIKSRRLHKEGNCWTYRPTGIDLNVVQLLRQYWRLSEKMRAP